MITYKLLLNFETKQPNAVFLIEQNKKIPFAKDNTDYQAYLKWVEEGGVPLPADEPQA